METKASNFRIPEHELALFRAARASMEKRLGTPISLTSWLRAVASVAARAELNGVDLAGASGGGLVAVERAKRGDPRKETEK